MIRFLKGNVENYSKGATTDYKDAVFFDTTHNTIYLNGVVYGGSSEGLTEAEVKILINNLIKTIELTGDINTNGYEYILTDYSDSEIDTHIHIPIASSSAPGVLSTSLYNKLNNLDTTKYIEKEEGKGLSTNDFTTELKDKLESISLSGEANIINSITLNGTEVTVENKIAKIDITDTVKGIVGTVYTFKGSVNNFEDLDNITSKNEGDVYNIINESNKYSADTNVAWDGEKWDPLGGTVDLSSITSDINTLKTNYTDLNDRVADVEEETQQISDLQTAIDNLYKEDDSKSINYIATSVVNNALEWEEIE